jgi:hypothetical protein
MARKALKLLSIGLALALGACLPALNIDEVFGEYAGDVPSGQATLTIFPDQRWRYKIVREREFSRDGMWMHEPKMTTEQTEVVISLSPFEFGFQRFAADPQRPGIALLNFERVRLISGLAVRTCFGEYTWCLTKVKK